MREIIINKKGQIEILKHPTPEPQKDYVLIRITAIPMCTEWHSYKDKNEAQSLGHEAAGIVEAVGPQVHRVKIGDRVVVMPQDSCGACPLCLAGDYIHCVNAVDPFTINGVSYGRATFATHCLQQERLLVPVPADISDKHASMACCGLGPTFNATQLMNVRSYDTVLIAGLGPVGLGGVINATHLGARTIGLDPSPYRAELAKQLGAEAVIDPTQKNALEQIFDLSGGVDKAVETSNQPVSPPLLIEALQPKGHLALVSWTGEIQVPRIVAKGLTVHGAWHWNSLRDTDAMFDVIRRNRAKLDKVITHTFPLEEVEKAWYIQISGQCGKIILQPKELHNV